MSKLVIALIVVVVLVVAVWFAYKEKWLNKFLPEAWQKKEEGQPEDKSNFVGAYGRTPAMQHCLAYSSDRRKYPYFNRCTYV